MSVGCNNNNNNNNNKTVRLTCNASPGRTTLMHKKNDLYSENECK